MKYRGWVTVTKLKVDNNTTEYHTIKSFFEWDSYQELVKDLNLDGNLVEFIISIEMPNVVYWLK